MRIQKFPFETPLFLKGFMREVQVAVRGPCILNKLVVDARCARRYRLLETAYDGISQFRAPNIDKAIWCQAFSPESLGGGIKFPTLVINKEVTMTFICVDNGDSTEYLDNTLYGHLECRVADLK